MIIVCNYQQLTNTMIDNVRMSHNTAAFDNDEFISNADNDLTSLVLAKYWRTYDYFIQSFSLKNILTL